MYIVEVTPFSKSIRNDSYSYFSSKPISIGSIVTVPLKNKNVLGLVIATKEGKELKTEIRSSDFTLKKVKTVSSDNFLRPQLIETAIEIADYFATSVGSIINTVIPKTLLEEIDKFKKTRKDRERKDDDTTRSQKYIIQSNDEDRYSEYKSIIREQFAKNKSVIFIVPTIEDCELAKTKISRGIEQNTFILNGKINKKNVLEIWKKISKSDKPIVLIATARFISLPIANIGMIIVERENSAAYKTQSMPYIDLRLFCEKYAQKLKIPFLYGDLMLRSETLKRYDEHLFFEYSPIKFRVVTDAIQKMVDLKDDKELIEKDNPISKSLFNLIESNVENNEHLFILNNRKGLAPLVVCEDCGHIVRCDNCDSPVVLYGKDANQKENYFYCNFCGNHRSAGEKCSNCSSWRLKTVGFGVDKIKKEIAKLFPKIKIFVIDKDHTKTVTQAQKNIKEFYDSASAILIGTELALLYLNQPIQNVAVGSIDSLFSSPDFRIRERILNILLKAKTKSTKNFLIQSRNLENNIFRNLIDGNLTDFYREEFTERKRYNFPPFSLIIKISTSSRDIKKAEDELQEIGKALGLDDLIVFESVTKRRKGLKTAIGIMRVDRDKWPDQKLIEKIKTLPAKIKLEIDAESIF